jgi:predicted GIY-YIG superfamily endonuclease
MNYLSYITDMGKHKRNGKHFVYEIINILGTIEYVGETYDIEQRFQNHISKSGKFYGRNDIIINQVAEFDNRKDAFNYQCELQKQYGFETDFEKNLRGGPAGRDAHKKSILCFDFITNKFIKQYDAITDAAQELNMHSAQICRVLKGERNKCHGYRFEYVK